MTRPRLFLAAVLVAFATAFAGSLAARPPAGDPPAYALDSTLVWHVEVAVVLFVALYATIITVRLASHGMTVNHVGSPGIDIPQLDEELRRHKARVDRARPTRDDLWRTVNTLADRIAALERPGDERSTPREKEAWHDAGDC